MLENYGIIAHPVLFTRRSVKSLPRRYVGALQVFGTGRGFGHRHARLVLQTSVMQRSDAVPGRVFRGSDVHFQTAQRVPFRVAATEFLCGNRV